MAYIYKQVKEGSGFRPNSSFSSVYDESLTRMMDENFFKICSWYDNEWGFSNRMLDVTKSLMNNA